MGERLGRLESRWTVVNGLALHARVSQRGLTVRGPDVIGPAVVMIHGLLVSSRYMVPTALRLAPDYRVFALDLPGYGKSDKPPRLPSVQGLSDVVVAWMDAVGVERAVLLGNSFGCQIAVDCAVRYPQRVGRLVLIGPTVDPHAHTLRQQAWRLLRDGPREPLSYMPLIAHDAMQVGLCRAVQATRAMMEHHIELALPHVRVPALVVRGGRDPIVPQSWAEEATALLPRSRLVVIPAAAHVVNFNAPRQLVRVLRPFLDACPAG